VQAEWFDEGASGDAYFDTDGRFGSAPQYRPDVTVDIFEDFNDASNYVIGRTREGEYLEYTVTANAAGEYVFDLLLDAGGSVTGGNGPGDVAISVDRRHVKTLNPVSDGRWWTPVRYSTPAVALSAGEHIVRIKWIEDAATGSSGNVNFDYFAVRRANDPNPAPTVGSWPAPVSRGAGEHCVGLGDDADCAIPTYEQPVDVPATIVQVEGPVPRFLLRAQTQGDLRPGDITVRLAPEWRPPAMADVLASEVFEINSPDLYRPIANAQLTIPYDTNRFSPAAAADLKIWTIDPESQLWLPVEGDHNINTTQGTVTTTIDHFSPYAVMPSNPDWLNVLRPEQVCPDPFRPGGVDVVFIVGDSSFSNSTANSLVRELSSNDRAAVVSLSVAAEVELGLTSASNAFAISLAAFRARSAASGINITPALLRAQSLREPDRTQVVVLVTDGALIVRTAVLDEFMDSGGQLDLMLVDPDVPRGPTVDLLEAAGAESWDLRSIPLRANSDAYGVVATSLQESEFLDSDGDGLTDCVERTGALVPFRNVRPDLFSGVVTTDPERYSSDDDVLGDGTELEIYDLAARPLVRAQYQEVIDAGITFAFRAISNPLVADTDRDGDSDGLEHAFGSDALSPVLELWQLEDRARNMTDREAVSTLLADFDAIARVARDDNTINGQELIAAVAGSRVDDDVRVAALKVLYDDKLTAGAQPRYLFAELDVASETDVDEAMFRQSFSFRWADGNISRADLDVYPRKRWELTTIAPWVGLIDTARQGYDLDKADGFNPNGDWVEFVLDPAIPDEVRMAAASIKSWARVDFNAAGQPTRWPDPASAVDRGDAVTFGRPDSRPGSGSFTGARAPCGATAGVDPENTTVDTATSGWSERSGTTRYRGRLGAGRWRSYRAAGDRTRPERTDRGAARHRRDAHHSD